MRSRRCSVVLLVAACTIACSERRTGSPAAPSDAAAAVRPGLDAAAAAAVEHDAAAPGLVIPTELTARLAVADDADDGSVIVYALGGGKLTVESTTPLQDVRHLAWLDPMKSPIVARGAGELGELRAGALQPLATSGRGDIMALLVDRDGALWIDRCAAWGEDNPEEEGCLKHAYWPLAGGKSRSKAPPPPAPVEAAAPADLTLTTRSVEDAGAKRHVLECGDAAGTRTLLDTDAQVVAPLTWRWLATTPPVALVAIEYAGSGEGNPDEDHREPYLLRGCTLSEDAVRVQRGPGGLWAEWRPDVTSPGWRIYLAGTPIAEVPGDALVFAGGEVYDGWP